MRILLRYDRHHALPLLNNPVMALQVVDIWYDFKPHEHSDPLLLVTHTREAVPKAEDGAAAADVPSASGQAGGGAGGPSP